MDYLKRNEMQVATIATAADAATVIATITTATAIPPYPANKLCNFKFVVAPIAFVDSFHLCLQRMRYRFHGNSLKLRQFVPLNCNSINQPI